MENQRQTIALVRGENVVSLQMDLLWIASLRHSQTHSLTFSLSLFASNLSLSERNGL